MNKPKHARIHGRGVPGAYLMYDPNRNIMYRVDSSADMPSGCDNRPFAIVEPHGRKYGPRWILMERPLGRRVGISQTRAGAERWLMTRSGR